MKYEVFLTLPEASWSWCESIFYLLSYYWDLGDLHKHLFWNTEMDSNLQRFFLTYPVSNIFKMFRIGYDNCFHAVSVANSLRVLRETFNESLVVFKIWHLQKGNDIKGAADLSLRRGDKAKFYYRFNAICRTKPSISNSVIGSYEN